MKVFVTGATGLVGSHIVAQLAARGDEVLALRRNEATGAGAATKAIRWIRGSLADRDIIDAAIADCDAVVHAAAIIINHGTWDDYHAANVAPTEFIAQTAARHGKRLIHISSVAVYGRRTTYDGGARSVAEDFGLERPLFPGDHYARSKREAEQAVWRIADSAGLRAVALRPCVIYGERDRTFAIRVSRVVQRGIAPMIGRGDNLMSVVYAGNVAAAALCALDRPSVTGPFNIANDGPLTQRQFLEAFARGMGVVLRLVPLPAAPAFAGARLADALARMLRPSAPMTTLKTAVQFLAADNPYISDAAKLVLGWTPAVEPRIAAEHTGRWFAEKKRAATRAALQSRTDA